MYVNMASPVPLVYRPGTGPSGMALEFFELRVAPAGRATVQPVRPVAVSSLLGTWMCRQKRGITRLCNLLMLERLGCVRGPQIQEGAQSDTAAVSEGKDLERGIIGPDNPTCSQLHQTQERTIGGWWVTIGWWQFVGGSWLVAVCGWKFVGGNWLVAIGWWQFPGGNGLVAIGWWQLVGGSLLVAIGGWQLVDDNWLTTIG